MILNKKGYARFRDILEEEEVAVAGKPVQTDSQAIRVSELLESQFALNSTIS